MRDLKADLEICNKATPGPWLPGHLPDIEQDCEICKINAFYNKNVNREFIAAAREGWPHAIERAINAEVELAKLRKVAGAARRVMDAVMAQPQDVKERNIALAWLDAALAELDKEGV